MALAYVVEVLDGVDGKLARTKVETTAGGEWEHVIDYCIELSWWTALAFHFQARGLRHAYWLLLLLVGSDLVDRLAKRAVKKKVGRNLDDVANFDRFVRWIGGRRCINIWILAVGLLLGDPANAFVLICGWMAATAARACRARHPDQVCSSLPCRSASRYVVALGKESHAFAQGGVQAGRCYSAPTPPRAEAVGFALLAAVGRPAA